MDGEMAEYHCCEIISSQLKDVLSSDKKEMWSDIIAMGEMDGWPDTSLRFGTVESLFMIVVSTPGWSESVIPAVVEGDAGTHPEYTEEEIYRMEPTQLVDVQNGNDMKSEIYEYISGASNITPYNVPSQMEDDGQFTCKWVEPHHLDNHVIGNFVGKLPLEGVESRL